MVAPKTSLTAPTIDLIQKLRESANTAELAKDDLAEILTACLDVQTTPPSKRNRRTQQLCEMWEEHQEAVEEILDVLYLLVDWQRELVERLDRHFKKKVK